jgi:hypothetical protein
MRPHFPHPASSLFRPIPRDTKKQHHTRRPATLKIQLPRPNQTLWEFQKRVCPSTSRRMTSQPVLLSQPHHAAETRSGTPIGPPPHERPRPLHERIDDLIVATHRTKDLSLKDSQAGLLNVLALLKEARVILASRATRMGSDKPKDTETMVSQIWDKIHQLKRQATASSRPGSDPAQSWAAIVARGTVNTAGPLPFGPIQPVKPTAQRLREVKARFADPMERSNILGLSNRAILDSINKYFLVPSAAGIKRLPSGDLVIQTPTEDDRKSLIANQKWLTGLGSTGVVLLERFPVFVHVVRIANIDPDEAKAIQYLKDENHTLFPDLSIVRAAFPKSALTNTKAFSSLIVEVDSPEQANQLIHTGLCEGGEVKRCELFESGCKLTQCFNCQRYGHVAKACKAPVHCSYCGRGHSSKDCSTQAEQGLKSAATAMGLTKPGLIIAQPDRKKSAAFKVFMLKSLSSMKHL